jgi:NitT/TauT family transport system substrate-binding protein
MEHRTLSALQSRCNGALLSKVKRIMRIRDPLYSSGLAMLLLWLTAAAVAAEPLKLRIGWLLVPAEITPILFPVSGIAKHSGVSYVIEPQRFQGSSMLTTAIASGELDIAPFGYSSFALAVQNAHLSDLRIIADEVRDGAGGHFTTQFMVKKDSPYRAVEDLRGKVIATNAIGSIGDMATRFMLRKHGLNDARDVNFVEAALPNMNTLLAEGKADLIPSVLPFYLDPGLQNNARTLFTGLDALGPAEISMLTASEGFVRKNRAVLVDFLEDYLVALRWYNDPANHDAVVAAVAKFTTLPPERFSNWVFTSRDYYRDPRGLVDLEALQRNVDVQQELGFLKNRVDVKPYVDMSLVEEAAQRVH